MQQGAGGKAGRGSPRHARGEGDGEVGAQEGGDRHVFADREVLAEQPATCSTARATTPDRRSEAGADPWPQPQLPHTHIASWTAQPNAARVHIHMQGSDVAAGAGDAGCCAHAKPCGTTQEQHEWLHRRALCLLVCCHHAVVIKHMYGSLAGNEAVYLR